ncbi:MAG: hypothetical protein JWO98_237 [Frankiales bacterium]|nr:hypothetical protein [Frankiales bacterium]
MRRESTRDHTGLRRDPHDLSIAGLVAYRDGGRPPGTDITSAYLGDGKDEVVELPDPKGRETPARHLRRLGPVDGHLLRGRRHDREDRGAHRRGQEPARGTGRRPERPRLHKAVTRLIRW